MGHSRRDHCLGGGGAPALRGPDLGRGPRAGPRLGGFAAAIIAILATVPGGAALAVEPVPRSLFVAVIASFAALERHEIAALALTLGVVLFAVLAAIALVRTRARASERNCMPQVPINVSA